MVLGYHVILSTYGFWLPNDPRGSWSEFVGSFELYRYGRATKIETTRSVANASHNIQQRRAAKTALQFPPVNLSDSQKTFVAAGFEQAVRKSEYHVHACAILASHTHLVIGRKDRIIEQIVAHLKGRATQCLTKSGWNPQRPVWAQRLWKVYLNSVADMERAIRYVEQNPTKEGKAKQNWSFMVPYQP